jgi:antitoxin (DNA-binding transcriptional repressor) of toxin-antitoxin stability system
MKTMTVRDIRLKWPEAERQLARVGEIVVTRDATPVARLLPYVPPAAKPRQRLDPAAQLRWMKRFWGDKVTGPTVDEMLSDDRADD